MLLLLRAMDGGNNWYDDSGSGGGRTLRMLVQRCCWLCTDGRQVWGRRKRHLEMGIMYKTR
jgi:ABC-type tungstate transport system permease subunit